MAKHSKAQQQVPASEISFLTLSAELRNKISEAALLQNKSITVGTAKIHIARNRSPEAIWDTTRTRRTWREPVLLRVCKFIRPEASPMYYLNHNVIARARPAHFAKLADWLEQLSRGCGPRLCLSLSISPVRATWQTLPNAMTLARFLHCTKLVPTPGAVRCWETQERSPPDYRVKPAMGLSTLFTDSGRGSWKVNAAYDAAVKIG